MLDNYESKTTQDFQNYVNEHKIKHQKEFMKVDLDMYNYLKETKIINDIIYYGKLFSNNERKRIMSNLNTLEDFQEFINKYKVKTFRGLLKISKAIGGKLNSLGLSNLVIYYGKSEPNKKVVYVPAYTKYCNTLEDFQKFVNDNNIQNLNDLKTRFSSLYRKLMKQSFYNEIEYCDKEYSEGLKRKRFMYSCNTVEDFQKVINEKEYGSAIDFIKDDKALYNRMCRLNYNDKVVYKEIKIRPAHLDWTSIDDFQKYVDENGIERPIDLIRSSVGVYKTLHRRGFSTYDLKFPKTNKLHKLKQEETFENIMAMCDLLNYEFVNKDTWTFETTDTNNIQLRCNIHNIEWITCYESFINCDKGRCPRCRVKSKGELIVLDFLSENGIKCKHQEHFKFIGRKSIDIYLPDFNIAIEVQGEEHFYPVEIFGGEKSFVEVEKRDRDKFIECNENGITIIYYTYCKSVVNKDKFYKTVPNYFAPVHLTLEDLWNNIKEIIESKQDLQE